MWTSLGIRLTLSRVRRSWRHDQGPACAGRAAGLRLLPATPRVADGPAGRRGFIKRSNRGTLGHQLHHGLSRKPMRNVCNTYSCRRRPAPPSQGCGMHMAAPTVSQSVPMDLTAAPRAPTDGAERAAPRAPCTIEGSQHSARNQPRVMVHM